MPLVAFVLIQVYVADLVLGREAVSAWFVLDTRQDGHVVCLGYVLDAWYFQFCGFGDFGLDRVGNLNRNFVAACAIESMPKMTSCVLP